MEHNEKISTDKQKVDSLSDNIMQSEAQDSIEAWMPDDVENEPKNIAVAASEINENSVIDAISTVYDPEIPVNVYELGLIYAVDLHDDGRVHVEMTLTAPNCPSAQELPVMIQQAIEKVPGVTQVQVEVVWDPPWDVSRMSDEARLTLNMF